MLHLFCHGFAVFVAAASIFAQSNETTPPSGKDFKSILIVPAKETKPWSINFAPYGWVTAVDGTITLRGITSDVHESAIETLKSLDFAFMAAAEIRYKRWGILGDFIYAKTTSLSSTPRGVLFSTATADLEEFIGTFLLEYRPLEAKWGFLDVLAGARVYAITSSLHLQGHLLPDLDITRYLSWVDPIIGIKGRIQCFALVFHQCLRRRGRIRSGIGISHGRRFWVQGSKFPGGLPSSPAIAHLDTTFGRTTPLSISSRTVPTQALKSPSKAAG